MPLTTLSDALGFAVEDLLSAERLFRDTLPRLSEASSDGELAEALSNHHLQTVAQVERLRRALEHLGRCIADEPSAAGAGMTAWLEAAISREGESPVREVALVSATRAAENYEIIGYADALLWATALGHQEVMELLSTSLEEERAMDQHLARIAVRLVEHSRRK